MEYSNLAVLSMVLKGYTYQISSACYIRSIFEDGQGCIPMGTMTRWSGGEKHICRDTNWIMIAL